MNFTEDLQWRGLIADKTPDVEGILSKEKITAYIGFDPTSKSLHIGNLIAVMGLVRLQRSGHSPIALVGGGTGLIGDPSGKASERSILSKEAIEENLDSIKTQLENFLDFGSKISNSARILNNAEWLSKINLIDFLRDTGKHFTLNYMTGKESVKSRVSRDTGISFTEFSYMTLQAYDFLHLYENEDCKLQMGGSDQWGNILAGRDLINRKNPGKHSSAHGIVFPLITSSSGEKFGKSAGEAPTLDSNRTSPYKLYQFFLNTPDDDVIDYLKYFTLLSEKGIQDLADSLRHYPKERMAPKKLAQELVTMIHGKSGFTDAVRITDYFFNNKISELELHEIDDLMEGSPSTKVSSSVLTEKILLGKFLTDQGIFKSMGDMRRMVQQGAVRLNGEKITDIKDMLTLSSTIDGKVMIIRKGSKEFFLIKFS